MRRIPVALATQLTGRRYCDEITATGKKHLDVAISTLFRGYCHVFAVEKLITCTSDIMELQEEVIYTCTNLISIHKQVALEGIKHRW